MLIMMKQEMFVIIIQALEAAVVYDYGRINSERYFSF